LGGVLQRPARLSDRQITGRTFSEDAVLITETGDYNDDHVWAATTTETAVKVATVPETRQRMLTEGGVRLSAVRRFWFAQDVQPATQVSSGDKLRYDGELWQVQDVMKWDTFSDVSAVRVERQRVPT
ncbi:MAG: hypothetical protein OXC29_09900, partial [Rhodococcus sp.]|nr:hypothetical protein [Rhodococcus sp. (in: high G+C Gram-positive bacteria)]